MRWFLRFSSPRWITILVCLGAVSAGGQTQQPPTDPLMALMMSQPTIDLSGPLFATASFDPPAVRPGQTSIYRVTFNSLEQMVAWPEKIDAPENLKLTPGAHGQVLQPGGAGLQPRTTFNSRIVASAAGRFTVPTFEVQVDGKPVNVPAASLEVSTDAPPSNSPRLLLELAKTNLFIGEPLNVRVLLPGSAGVVSQAGPPVQFPGQGYLVDQASARQRFEMRYLDGTNLPSYLFETVLTPIETGKIKVAAQAHAPSMNYLGGPIIISTVPGAPAPALYTLLETDPAELEVSPLPIEGRLPGFTGAIGKFSLDPSRLDTNRLHVGDPLKLTVVVRAQGPMGRIVPPPPPKVTDWQVFPAGPAGPVQPTFVPGMSIAARLAAMGSLVGFTYTLVPLVNTVSETPPIPFSYFDPERSNYVDLTVPPVPVTVTSKDGVAEDAPALLAGSVKKDSEKPLVLGSLARSPGWGGSLVPLQQQAWFPLAQLAPAAAFFGLWLWDRRRRFLEQHPQLVLRRRALRALRRERRRMRRAAARRDQPAFSTAALDAIKAACSADYGADPRALIGSDVLHVIRKMNGDSPPASEAAIRQLFEANDASRFGSGSAAPASLLELRPELERVLARLEARL